MRAHTHRNTHTHTYSLQYNIAATVSISAERPEVNCYQAGPSTAGSGAVCLSDDRSISQGWRTDRWRLRGVMNVEKNARKTASSPETERVQFEMRGSHAQTGHTRSHTQDAHLFTLFRFSVKLRRDQSTVKWSGSSCDFFLVGFSGFMAA